ncbi:MAG: hypothetical protein RLN96_04650 [Pseudomonadales bacterium]|tara:strand:- start:391 stop:606 length:216 start_codon:yes stop_codon:yes gene_type:complete
MDAKTDIDIICLMMSSRSANGHHDNSLSAIYLAWKSYWLSANILKPDAIVISVAALEQFIILNRIWQRQSE